MKKVPLFVITIALFFVTSSCIAPSKEKVKWLTLSEFKEAYAKEPRPVIIDLYTSWCGWCKVMDKETYGSEKVASYINKTYYAIKFNAETKDSVEFAGKKFGYNKDYKTNELAIYLSYGQLSYPTTVLLSQVSAQPAPLPGFLKPKELEGPLKFFGDGAYKDKNYPEFEKSFASSW